MLSDAGICDTSIRMVKVGGGEIEPTARCGAFASAGEVNNHIH